MVFGGVAWQLRNTVARRQHSRRAGPLPGQTACRLPEIVALMPANKANRRLSRARLTNPVWARGSLGERPFRNTGLPGAMSGFVHDSRGRRNDSVSGFPTASDQHTLAQTLIPPT